MHYSLHVKKVNWFFSSHDSMGHVIYCHHFAKMSMYMFYIFSLNISQFQHSLSAVDLGLYPRSVQTKDYKIGICCFTAKHAALRKNSKDWLAWNRDNVSEWSDMSICGLLFQWASIKNPIKHVGLAQNRLHYHHLIEN